MLATPFSAEQIRLGMRKGTTILLETSGAAGLISRDEWLVVGNDPESVEIRYTSLDAKNRPIGATEQRADSWDDLRAHAAFPRARASRERTTFSSKLGELEGWLYTVEEQREGGARQIQRYWFADRYPGAPVLMLVESGDGSLVVRMEQVKRIRG